MGQQDDESSNKEETPQGRPSLTLEDADCADDERKVGRDAEGVVKRDLRQISGQLLEVDVLGASPLQCLVKHLVEEKDGRGAVIQVLTLFLNN